MTPSRSLPLTVPPPPVMAAPALEIPSQSMEYVAALALGFYLATQAMWANEFLYVYLHMPSPIFVVAGLTVFVLWMLSGRYRNFWRSSIVVPYLLLLLWWWVCTALGSLRGEYSGMLLYGLRFHLTPFIFCGIAASVGLLRTVVTGYGTGFIVLLLLCAKFGEIDSAGRLGIPDTSLENPNDLALTLLIGLSFLSVLAFDTNILKRLIWFIAFGMTLFFVLRTGSRANLLTLATMLLVIFFTSKSSTRVMFVVSTLLMSVVMLLVIPKATLVRLTTFVSYSNDDLQLNQQVVNATSSTEARKQLQIQALKVSIQHPIFGVGPKMFLYALDEYMRTQENAAKGTWLHPHNTYLNLSAETGLPGLILYCWIMFWCIRTNYRGFQRSQREAPLAGYLGISVSLLLASVALAFGTLFCSWPYASVFCYLVGLTAAGQLILREYDERRWAMAEPPPSPRLPFLAVTPPPAPVPALPATRLRLPRR